MPVGPIPSVKILLVDDLQNNLLALSALLDRPGVELLTARSGSEALELLLAHAVGLTLIDVQMPGMDGFELAENHPANGVAWLANKLAPWGESLAAGEVVLAGSFTRPTPAERRDVFQADYGPLGVIDFPFA